MLTFLAVLFIALASFDTYVTVRMAEHEMNPLTVKAMAVWGKTYGAVLSVFVPGFMLVTLCLLFELQTLLAALCGARGLLALQQLHTLRAVTKG